MANANNGGVRRDVQRRGWVVVVNNYAEVEKDWFNRPGLFEYACFGLETAPSTGTPHLQGYIHLRRKARFAQVRALFPGAHIEPANGSAEQNRDYCSKEGRFTDFGVCPLTGPATVRRDFEAAKALAQANRIEEIEGGIYIPYYNTLKCIAHDHMAKCTSRDELVDEWHFGPTGCGKSRPLREAYPNAFIKEPDKYWDDYAGEDEVIIEDVDKYDVAVGRFFKLWTDHYPFKGHVKHKPSILIRPKKLFFTSNYKPSEIWSDHKTWSPIERRCKLIEHGRQTTLLTVQQCAYYDIETQKV